MIDEIRQLEGCVREALEPDAATRARFTDQINDLSERFVEDLGDSPGYRISEDNGAGLYDRNIRETPDDPEAVLAHLEKHVLLNGVNGSSGAHLAYIPISSLYTASWADYLAALTNRFSAIFFASPGAVRMEHQVVRWITDLVGMPQTAGGVLNSGGSTAHLSGIVTARESKGLKARDYEKAVVYMSRETHYCVDKALCVAGMRETVIRRIPMDDQLRMIPQALGDAIQADQAAGLIPWMVVANAGTTNTGAIDPLDAIADLAERYGLWFHVDAAYGGFFMLVSEFREKLKGLERADTLVMDPHKGLFIPAGVGVCLARDVQDMHRAHAWHAEYLQDTAALVDELSPAELSHELTRPFRALRIWLPLMLHGVKPFRDALKEKLLLTRHVYQRLAALPDVEMGPFPQITVVSFRFVPESVDGDSFNQAVHEAMMKEGRAFLSSTLLDNRFTLRVVILSYRTHLDFLDEIIDSFIETKNRLLASWPEGS